MKTKTLASIRPLAAAAILGGSAGSALAQAEYEFTLVDAFASGYGLRETYLWDINEQGVACGTTTIERQVPGGTSIGYTGFYWSPASGKTAVELSWPRAISNPGLIAGVGQVYDIPSAQFTSVPGGLPGTYSSPILLGVNDRGVAAGYILTCNCSNSNGMLQKPYVWDAAAGPRLLNVPGATGASRVNAAGQVIGWIGGNGSPNSFVYDLGTGAYTIMGGVFPPPPAGGTPRTTADDISDAGVVVGSRMSDDGLSTRGYTWSPQAGVAFLPFAGPGYQDYVRPSGINSSGVVVGSIATPTGSARAFVYDAAHGVRDLNTLTTPPAGFIMMAAARINDQGWIVGYGQGGGGMYKAFVLRPLAQPCYANCDGSSSPPLLNVNDFICFQSKYAAQDPAANCDASTLPPVLNVNDFVCFQQKYSAGCP